MLIGVWHVASASNASFFDLNFILEKIEELVDCKTGRTTRNGCQVKSDTDEERSTSLVLGGCNRLYFIA